MNRIKFFAGVFALLFCFQNQRTTAQDAVSDTSKSANEPVSIGEIVVSSFRINRKIRELPTPLTVIESYDYQKQSALTISNALNTKPGIAMGSDGVWATNINIRGFSESRLVTLIDGNREETATDLTASLSMVDVNEIERVEVIKGAQSSLYGTGAMGGIVNIITQDGYFADKSYLSGNLLSGYASANNLFTEHLALNTGSKKWYLRVSGSYSDANDIRTPEGDLPNSQYTFNNVTTKFGFQPKSNHLFKIQYQRYRATDVGIPGGAAFSGPSEATYTDIGRQMLSASYEITNISNKLVSLKLNYFTQDILRDVAMIPNSTTETTLANGNTQYTTPELVTPTGEHLTNGGQLQSTWKLSKKNTLIAGADVWTRKLTTEREKYITVNVVNTSGDTLITNNLIRGETPIPESSFLSSGMFFQDEALLLNDKLKLIIGGRVDGIFVQNEEGYNVNYLIVNGTRSDSPSGQLITFEESSEQDISWSTNAGVLYKINQDLDITLNLARSFRSPSLEERFKYIDLGNYVRLGNPLLDPESGYSVDLGFRIWGSKFTFQAGAYTNWLNNMIVETSGEFIYSLTASTDTDTVPALILTNVSKAMLYGADFEFQYSFYPGFVWHGSGSYVRGKDTEKNENLPQIPPMNGRMGIRYTYQKIGSAEFTLVGAAKQDKITEDETETDGYVRLDVALRSTKIKIGSSCGLQLFAGIDNLTDKSYTNHLSTNRGSISVEPGRNIYLRLNLSF